MILTVALIIIATIAVSFLCSLSEAALYSIPAGRIETMRKSGSRAGKTLAALRENVEAPISLILILNTTANTIGPTLAGAVVREKSGSLALGLLSAGFTLAILLFGEVVPKTLGVIFATRVAPYVAAPIRVLIYIFWPLVKITELTAHIVKHGRRALGHTEEDLISEASLGMKYGAILPEEYAWVRNVLRLNDIMVRDILTPRPVVFSLPAGLTLRELRDIVPTWTHARVPVTKTGDLDETVGVVMRRNVMVEIIEGRLDRTVGEMATPVHFVSENMRAHALLGEFIKRKQHLFMVVSEYGGVEGIVTLEDVVESLLGTEIVDELDRHTDMREFARKRTEGKRKAMKLE